MTHPKRKRNLEQELGNNTRESEQDFPPTWSTANGHDEYLIGPILRYGEMDLTDVVAPVAVVFDEKTERPYTVELTRPGLREPLFERHQPRVGDRIGIRRLDDGGYRVRYDPVPKSMPDLNDRRR